MTTEEPSRSSFTPTLGHNPDPVAYPLSLFLFFTLCHVDSPSCVLITSCVAPFCWAAGQNRTISAEMHVNFARVSPGPPGHLHTQPGALPRSFAPPLPAESFGAR